MQDLVEEFKAKVGAPEKIRRGVDVSEIFYIYALLQGKPPSRIIESGRALGQSTLLLAQCFPSVPIVSVESDRHHPDAEKAVDRLRSFQNVECLFGDSFELLPKYTKEGDVVVIDGPKEWKALKLAFHLMRRCRPSYIFIHDCGRTSEVRGFLEKQVPQALFSDDHAFVQTYCHLDSYQEEEKLKRWSDPKYLPCHESYGGTFACLSSPISLKQLGFLYKARLLHNLRKVRP